jgi:tetratricopeptide (TPR) repeat protein
MKVQVFLIRIWMVVLVFGYVFFPVFGANLSVPSNEDLNFTNDYFQEKGFQAIEEKDWNELLNISEDGILRNQSDPQMQAMNGYALRKLNNSEQAIIYDSNAIAIEPNPVRYANRGMTYLSIGNYSAALEDGESAIRIMPDYSTGYALKSLAYLYTGNVTEAKRNIDTALSINPDSASNLHYAGIIAMRAGDLEEAKNYLNRSIAIDPDYSLAWPKMENATVELERIHKTSLS